LFYVIIFALYLHSSLRLRASQNYNNYTIINTNYLFVQLYVETHISEWSFSGQYKQKSFILHQHTTH